MKNILLLVHDDAGQEARLQAALDLARAVGGHLSCLGVVEMPAMVDGVYGGFGEVSLLHEARAREGENRARLEGRLAQEDVSWSWRESIGDLGASLVDAAGTADVIVLNRRMEAFPAPDMRAVATQVLTDCDALVLAVPDDMRGFRPLGRALIGWDGSAQAMNAVQRALPLLLAAAEVRIVQIGERDAGIPIEDGAAYLSRHGRAVEAAILAAPGTVAAALAAEAARWGADYLVMGAYKHRPIAEALFGGVTRTMLSESRLPLLLAH